MLLYLQYSSQIRLDTSLLFFTDLDHFRHTGNILSLSRGMESCQTPHSLHFYSLVVTKFKQQLNPSLFLCFTFCHQSLYPLNLLPSLLHEHVCQYHWPAIIPQRERILSNSEFCTRCPINESSHFTLLHVPSYLSHEIVLGVTVSGIMVLKLDKEPCSLLSKSPMFFLYIYTTY